MESNGDPVRSRPISKDSLERGANLDIPTQLSRTNESSGANKEGGDERRTIEVGISLMSESISSTWLTQVEADNEVAHGITDGEVTTAAKEWLFFTVQLSAIVTTLDTSGEEIAGL